MAVRTSNKKRPGVMLYFDTIQPMLDALSMEDAGFLFHAIMEYAQTEIEPELNDPMVYAFFRVLKPALDKDRQKYEDTCESRRRSAEKRWAVEKGKAVEPEELLPEEPESSGKYACMQMHEIDANINSSINNNPNMNIDINQNPNIHPQKEEDLPGVIQISDAEFDRRREAYLEKLEARTGLLPAYISCTG